MTSRSVPVDEKCSCGATFKGTFTADCYARSSLTEWRKEHRHESPSAPLPTPLGSPIHDDTPRMTPGYTRPSTTTSPGPVLS